MELSPGLQRLVFVVIVIALAALGYFLVRGHEHSGPPSATASTPASSAPARATGSASVPPTMVPSATPASTAGGAEIYQWLPFTAADLTTAANTTTAFAKAYATWSYTESATAYAATFTGLATGQEITSLEDGYSTAGVAEQRTADKQVSTGSGTINSITSFGDGSITFLVTINDSVASTQPTATQASQYSVTVVAAGNGWEVNNIELSSLGNP